MASVSHRKQLRLKRLAHLQCARHLALRMESVQDDSALVERAVRKRLRTSKWAMTGPCERLRER